MIKAVALLAAFAITSPSMAKDKSRVPATGPDTQTRILTIKCRFDRVKFKRDAKTRTTAATYRLDGCWNIPLVMPSRMVTWANVFIEIERARQCGSRPFRFDGCPNG